MKKVYLVLLLCILSVGGYAQTASRTSSVYAGTSPFQDSMWTFNTTNYNVIKRLGPTTPGHTITGINGLAKDPTTGTNYAIVKQSAVPNRVLSTINAQTGVCSDIGNMGDRFSTIAFNANGTLFGVTGNGAITPETMFRINKATGTKTLFRPLGTGADGEIIAFCPDNNKFYHWSGNSTVFWERMDTTGTDVIETLTYSGYPSGEIFGALYIGGGKFLVSNISSHFFLWDTSGAVGTSLSNNPDDIRGLILETVTSTITPSGPTSICGTGSVTLTVSSGTSNYQWYLNGSAISGATNISYVASLAGTYNCIYEDPNGISDSTPTGITVSYLLPPVAITGNTNVCEGLTTALSDLTSGGTWSSSNGNVTIGASSGIVTGVTVGTSTITYTGTNSCYVTTDVTVNPIPTVTLGSIPDVCAGGTATILPFSNQNYVVSKTVTFGFNGGFQSWTVPAGVTSIQVDVTGAGGGLNSDESSYPARAGYGGRVQATLTVVPGQVLGMFVGGKGGDGTSGSGGAGGFNGGGNGALGFGLAGGGGGGATDISLSPFTFADRIVAAGGGAGAGLNCTTPDFSRGGDGGNLNGEDGNAVCTGGNGFGGTQVAGGAGGVCGGCPGATGILGAFGFGGDAGSGSAGSGAGAGWYGGGGGQWDGGGGGSSYTDATLASSVVMTRGINTGDGQVTITYSIPSTYNIVWSGAAGTAGFVDVTNASVTSSPINIAVPGTASANTYSGTFTITNSNTACTSAAYPISLNINPIPDVLPVSNQAVCNGATTTSITFGTTVPGTTFNWTNSDPSIGLAASATGVTGIPSFTVSNTSSVPVNAVVTVTPVRLGCVGATQTFTITVNPTPDVVPSSNQIVCNGVATTAINFTGSVAGTVFSWTNTDPSIGLGASGSGNIAPFTATNSTPDPVTAVITVNTLANSCTGGSNSFTIVVNPTPVLSSALNPAAICDNTIFSYTPTSLTIGTSFTWFRDTVTGISNPAATGTGNPNEILVNTTPNPIAVVYVDTLLANGCMNTQAITVVVNPTPMLSSTLSPAAVCSDAGFTYVHTSLTSGTTFNWSRDIVSGITNPASTGVDTIRETLTNSTPNPIPVVYMDTLKANGCTNIQAITVTVNPKPILTTPSFMPSICDSSSVFYVPASATTGTTFTWSRPAVAGIANASANGVDTISETLYNNVANTVLVTYYDTLKANGCINVQTITVSVNPTPKLSSALIAPSICDSTTFNYTPLSNTSGSTFNWVRPFVLGIGSPAASGVGNPNEFMVNNTNDNLVVSYFYTLAANGCTHTQIVTDTVHPLPTLSSPLVANVCSGENFHYQNIGYVYGTTYTWTRANVAGITPATGTGSGNTIDEVLTNGGLTQLITYYKINLKANNCPNTQYVKVTVNPAPPVVPITTFPPSSLCSKTMYQNFGASMVPPAGQNYHWEATNAIVWATGADKQYCLVNFSTPGVAVVTLKSNVSGISCITNSSYVVNVGAAVSDDPKVVYFEGQFICLQNNEDSYQWGFDDGISLDSTIIAGENNPNYFISAPDLAHRHYWVITKHGDCMQKSYYNPPLGISEINTASASLKLYPNPASDVVNVSINSTFEGNYEIDVINLLGQKLDHVTASDRKAKINVGAYPAGVYLVDCYLNGVKVDAQRFIKN